METSYSLLIITCFLYGATRFIQTWDEFGQKLINVLFILAVIVLVLITGEDGFLSNTDDWYWADYILPAGAVFLGNRIGDAVDDDDWTGIFAILAVLGLVATIITTCCGI